ncbi:hypothetical protein [Actinomycetospora sp. TBRC 11914]|uniref:hypothetical protein n=1 Tax=Actinomycetospora sp. TBRC 11914 TaxID=2729387 RepID=UPI00145EAB68|nr:hypothetical protein [Actinomycetospora sp. TBRC 11914]NMO90336.1 hypothetical protein [Actinomycetospora sp. TBRC 11914]
MDFTLTQAIGPAGGLVIAAVCGAAAYGTLRVAQLPLAAVQIAIMGTISLIQPLMVVQVSQGDMAQAKKIALVAAGGMVGVTLFVVAASFTVPAQFMALIFSDDWITSRPLLPLAALSFVGGSLSAAYGPFLRAVGQLSFEVFTKAVIAPITIVLVLVGAWLFSIWGGAGAQAVGALGLGFVTVARARRSTNFQVVE